MSENSISESGNEKNTNQHNNEIIPTSNIKNRTIWKPEQEDILKKWAGQSVMFQSYA